MSFTSTLVATGAVALGYWVIRSVLQPGIDATIKEVVIKPVGQKPGPRTAPASGSRARKTHAPHRGAAASRQGDYAWYVVLDVPQSAGRIEIQEALRRRIAKARADGDRAALAELVRAASVGIGGPRWDRGANARNR